MLATLRYQLIRVPRRLIHHAGALTLRLPPDHELLDEVLGGASLLYGGVIPDCGRCPTCRHLE